MRLRPMLFATALVCAATLTMVGCEPSAPEATPSVAATATQAPQAALQRFYDQSVTWESCQKFSAVTALSEKLAGSHFTCATLEVPLDYDHPEGETITLQLTRYGTGRGEKTPLLFNPGGPGGGSISALDYMINTVFSDSVTDRYDLVAMDPRGVGLSSPVECFTPAQIDKQRASTPARTPAQAEEEAAQLGKQCLERSPKLVAHVDTGSVVRDFDVARAALRQDKLNYAGFSYGTFIGALYADAFPSRVGRFVLDGAMDPSSSISDIARGQAQGFEAALGHWLESELAKGADSKLPLPANVDDAKAVLRNWLDGLEDNPLATSDPKRPLTRSLAASALLSLMYSTQTYGYATAGLAQAMNNEDGSILLQMADAYANRRADGSYEDNSFDAFMVINALDYEPVGDAAQWEQNARELEQQYPLVGSEFAFSEAGIAGWPVPSKKVRHAVKGEGAGPILVVGTTHDPATPYPWAQALAKQVQSATLLTWEGWNHCAYSSAPPGSCVRKAVDNYLLQGSLPAAGTVCN